MSDLSNYASSFSTQRSCECYKKLQTYGIPLHISDENDFYAENQGKITFEKAFELPGVLKINENITEYLRVEDNELCTVFRHMSEVIPNLTNFEQNVLNFWMLDVFIEALYTAQNAKMSFEHQKATLQWIAYFFNYIRKENPTRKELFTHLKKVLFHVECNKKSSVDDEEHGESVPKLSINQAFNIQESSTWNVIWELPLPPNVKGNTKKVSYDETKLSTSEEGDYEVTSTVNESSSIEPRTSNSFPSGLNVSLENSLINLSHMKIILDILYRIFGRHCVYMEIQAAFHAMPSVEQVDLPFTLRTPKPLLKPDTPTLFRPDKLRRPSYSEKILEEADFERELYKNDFILPLQVADESKLILRQFFPQSSSQRSVLGRRKS